MTNPTLFSRLKNTIETRDTVAGRLFDGLIQALIILSTIEVSLETLPGLSATTQAALRVFETTTVAIFTVEYLLRVLVADNRRRYVFSFFGLIDLLAIAPFYLSLGLDLRAVRIFRLLRLFRAAKVFRYDRAVSRLGRALAMIREELLIFFTATIMVLYLSAIGIYYFEGDVQPETFGSVPHSLWWAVTTLTTVGYGDAVPFADPDLSLVSSAALALCVLGTPDGDDPLGAPRRVISILEAARRSVPEAAQIVLARANSGNLHDVRRKLPVWGEGIEPAVMLRQYKIRQLHWSSRRKP